MIFMARHYENFWLNVNKMKEKYKTKEQLINELAEMRRRIAELEKSETEHKQVEEVLRESENKFRSLAEKSLVGIYLIQDGIFKYVNPKLAEIFGYRVEELIGKRGPRDLTLQEDWPVVEKALRRRISGEVKSIHYNFRGITKNKEIIHVEVYGSRTIYQGRPAVIGTLSDITERRRMEERIRHLNLVLRAIRKVNQLIIREKDRNRLLKEACRLLIKTRGYRSAWTAILDESNKLITTAQAGLGKDFSKMVKLLKDGKLPNCGQRALSQPKVVVIKNPLSTCTGCPLVNKYHNRAAMTIRLEHREKIYGLLSVSIPRGLVGDKEEQSLFREVASDLALALHDIELEEERKRAKQKLQKTLEETIYALASAIEMRDPYTAGHQKRVTKLACAIAKEMGLSKEQIEGIRMAGLIHDIGKISIPSEILTKPGKLNDLEYSLIKTHPQAGYNILKGIEFPWPVAQIVLQHHERMDGSGYPQGLCGKDILLEAGILAVADVVEAMSSHRPYRPAYGIDKALEEISKNKGILYDPEVVNACLRLFNQKGFKFD